MRMFDVNILIYAHRSDQGHHDFYREQLEILVNESAGCALSSLVAVGFLRIVTHPRFPGGATPFAEAVAVVDDLILEAGCTWLTPGPRHWELTVDLCRICNCRGGQVADAQHAALAIEHDCTWVTRDTDFEAFAEHGLKLDLMSPASRHFRREP